MSEPAPLLPLLADLDRAVRAGRIADLPRLLPPLGAAAGRLARDLEDARDEAARSRLLLDRTLRVTLAEGLGPVADELLDALLAVVGARRGFVGLAEGEGWVLHTARNLERADLLDPEKLVSRTIIDRVLQTGVSVVSDDATEDIGTRSIVTLALRSVVCFPLRHGPRRLGFVYLDDPATEGLFDESSVAAVQAWLPLLGAALARATEQAETPALPGVLTRSPAMHAVLAELARVARFSAPILLTGETGTGKSLVARQVHVASPRAKGPFVHLNCGAIPESLLEAELFGAEAGAYTGAKTRRMGKFEAAEGGTLFLDELDAMPVACQVKLLVALQERAITRLGGNAAIPVDVRVVAAMGSDPFAAIAAGRLREDLYYRLAVFVARLPALRERREDIPLLAAHVLARTRERYGLPVTALSEAAERSLVAHDWPGNVRELENALDRAALLSRDGIIERLSLGGAAPTADGVLRRLQSAATALADAMDRREALRDLGVARAFAGALLAELTARHGVEGAFRFLRRDDEVRARNHQRTYTREVSRLQTLAGLLGEPWVSP